MAGAGMYNVGQLVRSQHPDGDVFLVGFGCYEGTVIAAQEWEAPMEKMVVPPAQEGSWEDVLHEAAIDGKMLLPVQSGNTSAMLAPRGHRAIGVVYHPDYEQGNYVPTVLPKRYDAFLFLDTTQALHPLHWTHAYT